MSELVYYIPVFPEILLSISAMLLMMLGVYSNGKTSNNTIGFITIVAFVISGLFLLFSSGKQTIIFNNLFIVDGFSDFMKLIILASAIVVIIFNNSYKGCKALQKFEFNVLVMFAVVGMFCMVSANDLMSLYLGLELQSLSLYVIASMNRESTKSTEAGLKYFILGAVASGILLYGASLIYGFSGATDFNSIAQKVADGKSVSLGIITGSVLVIIAILFKISAVPFHMWTPDVYEGVPKTVTAFFATAPKVAAFALFIRFLLQPFGNIVDQMQQIIILVSVASMVVGSFAAIRQTNIKRMMAYSSIGHVGFMLIGLAVGNQQGVSALINYLVIYVIMNLGVFACIIIMKRSNESVESINDLKGLGKSHPLMALIFTILMLSMAGIPPLAGFLGKFFIFSAAIKSGLYTLSIIGVITSVVGAFYYIRIIKIIYFDELIEELDNDIPKAIKYTLGLSVLFNLLFFIVPASLLNVANDVTRTLF